MCSTAAVLPWEYFAAPLCRSGLHPDPQTHPVLWANSKPWNCETEWTTWILISSIVQIPSAGSPLPRSGFGNLWQMRQTVVNSILQDTGVPGSIAASYLPMVWKEVEPCGSAHAVHQLREATFLSVVIGAAPPISVRHAALHTAWGFHPAAKCKP